MKVKKLILDILDFELDREMRIENIENGMEIMGVPAVFSPVW